jgi:ribosomal protein S18 acetylase RimI-like enzyme
MNFKKSLNFKDSQISFVQIEDLEAIDKLVNSAFRGESSKIGWTTEEHLLGGIRTDLDQLHALFRDENNTLLKLSDNNKILGIVNLKTRVEDLYLGMLTVDPNSQGNGLGKRLLFAAEEFAIYLGLRKISMTVISVRTELISWYERHGYIQTGEKLPFPMDDPKFGLPKMHLEFIVLTKLI